MADHGVACASRRLVGAGGRWWARPPTWRQWGQPLQDATQRVFVDITA
jgi:hypothetical protein